MRQLAIRDHPKLDDSSVYSLMISLRYLDNLDVRGCPKVSPSSTEKVIWNAQCDLPHRVNYFCGPYERVKFVKINSDFIFTSWKPGTINPFDLYSMFARQLLCSGQKLIWFKIKTMIIFSSTKWIYLFMVNKFIISTEHQNQKWYIGIDFLFLPWRCEAKMMMMLMIKMMEALFSLPLHHSHHLIFAWMNLEIEFCWVIFMLRK